MIVEESLKMLKVVSKGGGSIVSHRPVFSTNSKTLYIIQNNSILAYGVESGRCIGKFVTPSAAPIANIAYLDDEGSPDVLMVLTTSGNLLKVDAISLETVTSRQLNLAPPNWSPIVSILDFKWPSGGSINARCFYILAFPEDGSLPVIYGVKNDRKLFLQYLCRDIVPNSHAIDCGSSGQFVAAIQKDSLFVKNIDENTCQWHKSGSRNFTCVAVHPTEWVCATGDDSGRILIWTNALSNNLPVAKTVFHWHTLPVADLWFSYDGAQMFSGGGECTLVKWDIENTENKRTLPRMGLPIRHVSGSPNDDFIAVAHADNRVQIVDAYNKIVGQIQNITQCYIPHGIDDINSSESSFGGSGVFQAGVHLDPNNFSLVTNGRPGHLQCYSFRDDKHLYNLDITQQNFITSERNKLISNADVTHIAFSKKGTWLATGESRIDEGKSAEIRLKFWKFEREKQTFVLNTSIDWPHEIGIQSLKIQPISEEDPSLIAASSGLDSMFKTWGLVHDPSIHGKSEWWNCENVGSYRNIPCGPLSFSHDGSLLAVPFGKILTLWESESHKLKLSLCHSKLQENIKLVEFGSNVSSHLILACTNSNLIVWDVKTASLLWVAPFSAECIAIDPYSNLAVAFSLKHNVIYFSLGQSEPLAVHKNVSSSKVISAVFVPSSNSVESTGLKSTLFFLNSSQELCAFLPPPDILDEEVIKMDPAVSKSLLTPFAQLMAEKTVYEPESKRSEIAGGHSGKQTLQIIRDIMDQSPHTMPSMTYFCRQLLRSLSVPRNKSNDQESIENAVKSGFKKAPGMEASASLLLEQDGSQHKQSVTTEKKPFTVDLDLVANDDLSWIEKVFDRNYKH